MRTELKVLRVKYNLTQVEAAKKLEVSTATYNLIENGNRDGNVKLWRKVKKVFKLTDEQAWKIYANE